MSDDNDSSIIQPCPLGNEHQHWIEIELIGEDGNPIPWERYEITLPSGKLCSGFLDRKGKAKIDGIADPGQCQVTFPDLDAAAWDWLSASAKGGTAS